jgi:hypothetical protein
MKYATLVILLLSVVACRHNAQKTDRTDADTVISQTVIPPFIYDSTLHPEEYYTETEIDTFYVVIADTGNNYFALRERMMEVHNKLSMPIDTMDRHYDTAKGRIILAENIDDELYAGEYYPRRFPSQHLSIEYLSMYMMNSGDSTMALTTAIYEDSTHAADLVGRLKQAGVAAYAVKSLMYVGCLH